MQSPERPANMSTERQPNGKQEGPTMQGQQGAAQAHVLLRRVRQCRLLARHSDMHCLPTYFRSVLHVLAQGPISTAYT